MKSDNVTKVLYYEGRFDQHIGKFLNSVVKYIPHQIAGVLSHNPDPTLEIFLDEKHIPLFTQFEKIGKFNHFVITQLHFDEKDLEESRNLLQKILDTGATVINGSHTLISHEFAGYESQIIDLRGDTSKQKLFTGEIIKRDWQKRILTVGMDCNIGKMTASLEIYKYMKELGRDVEFVATGQIGMTITGRGIPLDKSIVDFTSGFMEDHLLEYNNQYLLIEGQGSMFTPLYSGLTLAQIHGSVPDYMILCIDPTREHPRYFPRIKLPSLEKAITLYEDAARLVNPLAKVIGISANTSSLDEAASISYLSSLKKQLNLPVFDPVKATVSGLSMEDLKSCTSQY